MASIKLFYKPVWPQSEPIKTSPTPTIIPISIEDNNAKNDYPLNKVLPYMGKTFEIKQYEEPLILLVKVKSKDQTAIEKEMTALFEKEGIDINSHKFDWQN